MPSHELCQRTILPFNSQARAGALVVLNDAVLAGRARTDGIVDRSHEVLARLTFKTESPKFGLGAGLSGWPSRAALSSNATMQAMPERPRMMDIATRPPWSASWARTP